MYVVTERNRHEGALQARTQHKSRQLALEYAYASMQRFPQLVAEIEAVPDGDLEEDRCSLCGELHAWRHS